MKYWQRASNWQKLSDFIQGGAAMTQAILVAEQASPGWNYFTTVIQLLSLFLRTFGKDENKNDKVDTFEDEMVVTSTTTTVIKKDEPVKSDTETIVETKKDE
jgi:hypothetical protein